MAARIPSRGWQRCRSLLRAARISLLLLVLFVVAAGSYLNEVGLPDALKRPLLAKLKDQGVDIQFTRLRLRWYRGLVAENVHFGPSAQGPTGPQLSLQEVELKLNHAALMKFQLNVDSLILHGGKLAWALAETNQPPQNLTVMNIQTQLRFLPHDQWELDHFMADFGGGKLELSGGVTNASALRDWKLFNAGGGAGEPDALRRRVREVVSLMDRIQFSQPPELKLVVYGDAKDVQSFKGIVNLSATGVKTPWGTLTNGLLAARLIPPGATNARPQAELKLRADAAATRWGDTRNFQLTLHASQLENATNLAQGRLEITADQLTTRWAQAKQAHLNVDWVHCYTNAIPLRGAVVLALADVSTRWGGAGVLRLNARLDTPATNGPPRADAQWGWWARLEPYLTEWSCLLERIHAEDAGGEKFDLQQLICDGLWSAPELTVTNVHAEMYQGRLDARASLNVATRIATFEATSDFDAQKAAPLLGEGARNWLHQFSWEQPPLVHCAGEVTLPAWTNAQPDWRGGVMPTLNLQGDFRMGNAAFRGVTVTAADGHFGFTNMAWRLPDLVVTRPEGRVELAHVSDERTKDFYFHVNSTIDVMVLSALLDDETKRSLDGLVLTQPPVIDAEVWGRWQAPELTGARAHVAVSNFTFRGASATQFHGDVLYTNRFVRLTDARVERGNEYMTASGVGVDIDARKLYLTNGFSTMEPAPVVNAMGAKVAQVIEPYHFLRPPTVRAHGTIPLAEDVAADLHFEVEGGPFRWMKFNLEHISGGVDWVGDHLNLTNVNAAFYQGQLSGSAAFNFAPEKGNDFSFDALVANAKLEALMADISTSSNHLEGTFSGRLTVTQANTDNEDSWNGLGQVDLRDGLIWEIPIFGVVSEKLDKISPGLAKSRANAGAGAFTITNSVIRSEDLEIRSSVMRMWYRGTVDFHGQVNARVEAELLRDTWLVGPLISTVLTPITKFFEYKVTGTLDNPKSEPLFGVTRFLMAPFHPFSTLQKIIPGAPADTNSVPVNKAP